MNLRELTWMAEAKLRHGWDCFAFLCSWMAKLWVGENIDASTLNPFRQPIRPIAPPPTPEEIAEANRIRSKIGMRLVAEQLVKEASRGGQRK